MTPRKVVLVSTETVITSHGLRSLSSYLKVRGHSVRLVFMASHLRCFRPEAVLSLLELCEDADLVGISCYSQTSAKAAGLADALRGRGLPVVWGGCHASLVPERCLEHADFVCQGEGEEVLLDLVESLDDPDRIRGIRNLWTLGTDGKPRGNPLRPLLADVDSLPPQDYDFSTQFILRKDRELAPCDGTDIGAQSYREVLRRLGRKGFSVTISRGCPFACAYCFYSDFKRMYEGTGSPNLRRKSVPAAIAELRHYKETLGLDPDTHFISFDDDDFYCRPESELQEFCRRYAEEIGIPFGAHAHTNSLSEPKLRMLLDAGLRVATVGLQSGSERINREVYRRKGSAEETLRSAKLLRRFAGRLIAPPSYHVINCNPYESEEDVWETIRLFERLPRPFNIQIFQLTFFPNSDFSKRAIADGMISGEEEFGYEEHYYDAVSFVGRRKKYRYAWFVLNLLVGLHKGDRAGAVGTGTLRFLCRPLVRRFFERNSCFLPLLKWTFLLAYKHRRHADIRPLRMYYHKKEQV